VESYLRYRGNQFVGRFDANSYLYITKALDYFDLANGSASLAAAFDRTSARFLVISFTSDWLYPTYQSREIVSALRSRNLDLAFCELHSSYGHDAFLLEAQDQSEMIAGFLASVYQGSSSPPRRTAAAAQEAKAILSRLDYAMIAELIEPGSRVLDLGCGEGELLAWLREHKDVTGCGVEIEPDKVRRAIAKGVSAYQRDIDEGLTDYPEGSFDFVILSQTLQEMRYPLRVLREMLRAGRRAIVAFPNFGHWSMRFAHLFGGHSPRTKLFPYHWFESPNLHFLTVNDFIELCGRQNWKIERQMFVTHRHKVRFLPNLFAEVAVFSIRRAN
ncbi:MAG: methionine biosynthesis protein MetW, partial [Bryobacteraceae bacterium]